jgi:hypothetical protein
MCVVTLNQKMEKTDKALTGLIAFRVLPGEKENIDELIQNMKTTKSEFFRKNFHKILNNKTT